MVVAHVVELSGDATMSETDGDTTFQPPYMSWATFENIIETLGSRGLPDQIDRSLLTSRSGGDQAQFLRAARAFKLIDEAGRPLPRLKEYVTQPDRRRDILREVLTESYPSVVALGTGATPQQLTAEFRAFGIEGDTVRKAETFYLNAARQAEIELSPHFKNTRQGAGPRKRSTRANGRGKADSQSGGTDAVVQQPSMHPAITTLVQALPEFDPSGGKPAFPESEREAWFAYARATFNLIYTNPEGGG